jgi:hypothetical protein
MKIKIKYFKELNNDMNGACLYWLTPPEIHLAENIRNTPTGAIVKTHELRHLKFYILCKKYPKYARFIRFCNDLYDFLYPFYRLFLRLL